MNSRLIPELMKVWEATLANLRLPASQIIDQLGSANLPPTGNTGSGYSPADHDHTVAGDGGILTNDVHDGYSIYDEIAAPSAPAANTLRLYAKDKSTVTELFYKNSSGTERDLSLGGTVTSVALTAPSELTVAGSPITTTGTLALTWTNQSANQVFAGPTTGGAATPAFRALVAADIPSLAYTTLTYSGLTTGQALRATSATSAAFGAIDLANTNAITGLLGVAHGGTARDLTATGGAGQVLKQTSGGAAISVAHLDYNELTATGVAAYQIIRADSGSSVGFGAIDISQSAAVTGILGVANGGAGANLSGTGGANQIVRQNSSGGAFTVSALAAADIPNLDTSKLTTGVLAETRGGTGVAGVIGARAFNSANQSINNNTVTTVTYDSESWDTDTIHSTVTNTGRLTCNTAGKYVIVANIEWGQAAGGRRQTTLRLNGTTTIASAEIGSVADATAFPVHVVSTIYDLAVNDYIETRVYQASGGNLNVTFSSNYTPTFMMIRIA